MPKKPPNENEKTYPYTQLEIECYRTYAVYQAYSRDAEHAWELYEIACVAARK